jgi:glycosyltransferase involved in cell wall biosynthesis
VRAPLTVVIPTLNEAAQIADCVRHVAWADEVIVADGGSTDGTPERARAAGAHVLPGSWGTIAAQRNAAIAAARHDWILAVDADERVSPELAREITEAVRAPSHEAYAARRRNVYLGRTVVHGGWGSDWVVRVFRRERRFVERRVHEAVERHGDVGRLRAQLEHVPYRDLAHHLEKLDRYARWAAQDLVERGRRARVGDLLLRPPARFVRMYVFQLGLLDGWHGAVLCGLASVSVFLKYAHLWELWRRTDA